MMVEALSGRLQRTHDPARRARLLDSPIATDSASFLLTQAQASLSADPARALQTADLVIEIAAHLHSLTLSAQALRVRAQALRALGRHQDAIGAFEAAAESATAAGDRALAAQVQIGCVDSLGWVGRIAEAVSLARGLVRELTDLGLPQEAAKVLANLGGLHFRRDQFPEALICYTNALEALQSGGDDLPIARVQANLAIVMANLNRIAEAIELNESARAVFSRLSMGTAAGMVDANVGYLRYISGEYPAALASFSRARQEFTSHNSRLELAKCDADSADVYQALNLYPEALECYDRAIAEFERIPLDYERGRAEVGRAGVQMAMDQPEAALGSLERADHVFRLQRNSLQRALVQLIRASIFMSLGADSAALRSARSAARGLTRRGQHGWAAEARLVIAQLRLQHDQSTTRLLRSVSRVAKQYGRRWLECRAERLLGHYYLQAGKRARALRHLRSGVSALEESLALVTPEDLHIAFRQDKGSIYEDIVGALLATGRSKDVAEAFRYVERSKSRLLLERVQSSLDRPNDETGPSMLAAREKLASLRTELCAQYHRLNESNDADRRRFVVALPDAEETLVALEQAYRTALNEVEIEEAGATRSSFGLASLAPLAELQSAVALDEMLIEYYGVDGKICAFLISRDSIQVRRDLATVDELAVAARRLRYHLQRCEMQAARAREPWAHQDNGVLDVLTELNTLLIEPLVGAIEGHKLVIIPHGVLHGLPFHAFYNGDSYALDRWEFTYAPSAAVWRTNAWRRRTAATASRKTAPGADTLVMGLSEPGLEHVSSEIAELTKIMPRAKVHSGSEATLSAFRRDSIACHRLHLATHALFRSDNPLFSGLRFHDGWLLARDLYEMNLDCDLATLSACRTGTVFVEAGDELFGLVRGFLAAGVRSLAASLWPADDAATASLMTNFYGRLAEGATKAAALRTAQRALRDRFPHPYYWAAFALIGER